MGCSNQAEVDIACLLVLPVELSEFSGKADQSNAILSWQTLSELNNDYFEVEHSIDGINFTSIGSVLGHGTSSTQHNYQFVHKNVKNDINYYRLKQVDFDGRFEYSKMISILFSKDKITFLPNPTIGFIQIKGINSSNATLKITDGTGRMVKNDHPVSDNQTINISDQPNGLYFFIIQTERTTIVKRIIKS